MTAKYKVSIFRISRAKNLSIMQHEKSMDMPVYDHWVSTPDASHRTGVTVQNPPSRFYNDHSLELMVSFATACESIGKKAQQCAHKSYRPVVWRF